MEMTSGSTSTRPLGVAWKQRFGYLSAPKRVNCYMGQNERSRSPLLNRIRMPQTLRVVIPDDETLARQKLRILLSEETGINIVAECSNGAETIRALRDYRPDLLLLDVQMPDMDGFEVLGSIAAEDL